MGCLSSKETARKDTGIVEVNECIPYRVGEWLPSDQAVLQKWLQKQIEEVDGETLSHEAGSNDDETDVSYTLHPVVQRFKEAIENNAEITMFFHLMFSEIPKKYKHTPTHKHQVRNYHHML